MGLGVRNKTRNRQKVSEHTRPTKPGNDDTMNLKLGRGPSNDRVGA